MLHLFLLFKGETRDGLTFLCLGVRRARLDPFLVFGSEIGA